VTSLLLSLILLSYTVALKRELANIIASVHIFTTVNHMDFNAISEDVNMETPRERSTISSSNSSRVSSIYFIALSIPYYAKMEQQSNDPIWTEQIDSFLDF